MKEWLEIIGLWIFWIVIIGLFGLGVYHSYDKHDDGVIIWSPFALYRGVEYFFYDEAKEWESELLNTSYFLNTMEFDNPPEFNAALEKYKERIADFSDEGKKYIRNYAQELLNYILSFLDDFELTMDNLKLGDKFIFDTSFETKELREKLKKYDLEKHLELQDEEMTRLVNYLSENLSEIEWEELEDIKTNVQRNNKRQKARYNFAYKRIFE